MFIKATFTNNGGDPAEGLSPIIFIIDMADGAILVNWASMLEVGKGAYKYDFSAFTKGKDYHIVCDSGDRTLDGRGYTYGGNELFTDEFIGEIASAVDIAIGEVFGGYGQ